MVQSHPREENEVVPPILEAVLKQPDEVHMQVAFTSVQLLAELNEWIACHPDVLPLVLQFLTKRLHNKHLATVAAKVCIDCGLIDFWPDPRFLLLYLSLGVVVCSGCNRYLHHVRCTCDLVEARFAIHLTLCKKCAYMDK